MKRYREWWNLMKDEMSKCNYKEARKYLFKMIDRLGGTGNVDENMWYWDDDDEGVPFAILGEPLWLAGHHYENGTMLFTLNQDKAKEFYRRSAELGNPKGMYSHGKCWISHEERGAWYSKVLETDDDFAKGMCHASRVFDIRNLSKVALEFFSYSATQDNNQFSQNQLGMYYRSLGGRDKECFEWYLKAAQQGHHNSQIHVGYCFMYGHGVPKNRFVAWKWHMKGSNQNKYTNADALGFTYGNVVGRENTRRALFSLLYIHKHKLSYISFSQTPVDIIKLVIAEIWKTRDSEHWNFGKDDLIK